MDEEALKDGRITYAKQAFEQIDKYSETLKVGSTSLKGFTLNNEEDVKNEKIRLAKLVFDKKTRIMEIEKKEELKAHDEKIKFKIIEIETVKAQITAQHEYLRALSSITNHMKENPIDFNSDKTKASMKQLDNMTKELKGQLSGLDANLRTTKAKGALKNLKYEIDHTKATIGINGNANSYYDSINNIKGSRCQESRTDIWR